MHGFTTFRIVIAAALALVGASMLSAGLQPQVVSAAPFTVTKTADTNDGTCDSDCSLREAVIAANATVAVHDNISIPAGTYSLTGAGGEDASATGDLDVTDSVSFNGSGMTTTIIIGSGIDGGIQVFNGATTLILTDLTIQQSEGDGITSDAANIDLANVAIRDNGDAGIITDGGDVSLQSSIVDGNGDAGISTDSGDVTLNRSTVSRNDGGIETANGDITTTNSTISDNDGSGISTEDGDITLNWSTVASNFGDNVRVTESGAIYLTGTIVADSIDADDCSDKVEDSEYSLDSDGTCDLSGIGDISEGDPDLGPLQDNGGTTETHALLGESQAIDAGGTGCPEDDQRSFNRYQGAACDIGAYEAGGEQNTPGPTSTPGSATATATPARAKTHTPTATGTPEATDTPAPATSTNTPTPVQPGGDRAGVVRGPDTGSGPERGSSTSLIFVAAMLAVTGGFVVAMGRKIRS